MDDHGFVARGGLWMAAQFLLMTVLLIAGPFFPGTARSAASGFAGGAMMAVGALFGLAGALALGRQITPYIRARHHRRLVRHGVYRWIRHPLYASLIWTALGWALFWLSGPALGLAAVLVLLLHFKSRREEQWLTERFPEYADYRTQTKRFLPGVW